jgi:hypothetical protein
MFIPWKGIRMKHQTIFVWLIFSLIGVACAGTVTPGFQTPAPTPTLLASTATIMPSSSPSKTAIPSNSGVPGAIEFETLPIKNGYGLVTSTQDMASFGAQQWSNGKQLFGKATQAGGAIAFDVTVSTAARYGLDVYGTLAPDFAILHFSLDGQTYEMPIDLYAPQVSPSGRIPIGGFDLSAGAHVLMFRVVGKNKFASNYNFGLDSFTLTPSPTVALARVSAPTFPPPNPAYPLLTTHLQAIQVMDDDGGRSTPVTPDQIKQWVEKANEIWAGASIRFLYDPDSDFTTLRNTLINSMMGIENKNWNEEKTEGDKVAARYPGKLVLFFRYGSGPRPIGGSFSWYDYNFVAMSGFSISVVCGYQNIGSLAHELGHYLGLGHLFPQVFHSIPEAAAYMRGHGNGPSAFDNDRLGDTLPDPYIDTPEIQCTQVPSITLNSFEFPLPRTNIMSYYEVRTGLSPQQIELARWVLTRRALNGMAASINRGVPGVIEFETLPIKESCLVEAAVQNMTGWSSGWSGGKQLFCNGKLGSATSFAVSVNRTARYTLNLYATLARDFGQIQIFLDGNPIDPPIDLYAPIIIPSGRLSTRGVDLTPGVHTLEFRVVGKNSASTGYAFGLDAFTLTPNQ